MGCESVEDFIAWEHTSSQTWMWDTMLHMPRNTSLKCCMYRGKLFRSQSNWPLEAGIGSQFFWESTVLSEWVFWLSQHCAWVEGSAKWTPLIQSSPLFDTGSASQCRGWTETPSPKHTLLQWGKLLYGKGPRGLLHAVCVEDSIPSLSSHNALRVSGGW